MFLATDLYRALFKRLRGRGFGFGVFNRFHKAVWEGALQPNWVDVEGFRLYLPRHDEGVADGLRMEGSWEKAETEAFKAHLKPGMNVLDVGANVGYYALLASRLVGPQGKVAAFEPEPLNFSLLMRSLVENDCRNASAYPYAASSALGFADLHLSWPASTGSHSIVYSPIRDAVTTRVVTVALDDFLDPSFEPDVIKMDIEGAELLALAGMTRLLGLRRLKTMFIESNAEVLRAAGRRPEDLASFLKAQGFQLQPIDSLNLLCTRG